MKQEVAQKWIKALRSGKYKQGRKALKYRDKGVTRHCCLGVLCELYQQEKKSKQQRCLKTVEVNPEKECLWLDVSGTGKCRAFRFANTATELPKSVQKWAGMHSEDGVYAFSASRQFNLAALNDKGTTFKEIADVIEKKCDEL
jgi:hypothetical protein